MTRQLHDVAVYEGTEGPILSVRGRGLFTPRQERLKTVELSTACRRGYHCRYQIREGRLFLEQVELALKQKDRESVLKGTLRYFDMSPAESPAYALFYKGIGRPVNFNGSIMIGLLPPGTPCRGTHSDCESYLRLTFADGELLGVIDQTEAVRKKQRIFNKLMMAYVVLFYLVLVGGLVYWLFL